MKYLIILLSIGTVFTSQAQKSYAKQILDTLCSESYYGRGYVNNGVEKSANYIEDELKRIGVKSFPNKNFQQDYVFDVNTFPTSIQVKLNDIELIAGQDYILNSNSGTSVGKFNVIEINKSNFLTTDTQPKDNKSIVVYNFTDLKDKDSISYFYGMAMRSTKVVPVVWVQDTKLTYSVGRSAMKNAMIVLKSEAYKGCQTITLDIKNKYIHNYKSQNVIGYIPSTRQCKLKSEKIVVISAHFDHLGQMGQAVFPGANDNASGVAMLLSMAKYYQDNPQKHAIVFCFFSGEEAGLEGSKYFVSHPYFNLKKIEFVLNIDIMGGASTGITVVNGSKHTKHFNKLVDINTEKKYLDKVNKRGETSNSDHYFFSKSNVPAFFIYSVGTCSNYHDIYDKAENAPLNKFDEVQLLLQDFIKNL